MRGHCPNCGSSVVITTTLSSPAGELSRTPDVRAIEQYIRLVGPKKATSTELYHDFTLRSGDNGWPPVTHARFSRILKDLGAVYRRTAANRTYQLPDLTEPEPTPAAPRPVVDPAVLADLPFEIG